MSDGKDTRSFFRKVVNFVVNPRGDAADPELHDNDARDTEFAKSELKSMIERKRRNDFVRKRELDLLRKLRREGLTPEQLAVLGSSSGMADTQTRSDEGELSAQPDMKGRIDEIEQQMASHAPALAASRRSSLDTRGAALQPPPAADVLERSMADTIIDAAQLAQPDHRKTPRPDRRRWRQKAASEHRHLTVQRRAVPASVPVSTGRSPARCTRRQRSR